MSTTILKFGGSSVADNIKLNVTAQKIIEFKEKGENVVVVVSAQGKTTDKLIKEAEELSAVPNERELDMLLSCGEQISVSKLSILLNQKGYPAISLTGWQAGICTNEIHKNAKIEKIYTKRIKDELSTGKIVIVAGFQGINKEQDITTLGRGGSDTTAVALEAALNAENCYIFSDVDGIYTADPNMIEMTKKLNEISFTEMQEIADAGAKVLHNRCIQIGEKYDLNIFAASTFSDNQGTKICKEIEGTKIKSIVKNTKLVLVKMKKKKKSGAEFFEIYNELLKNNIILEEFKSNGEIAFRILKSEINKLRKILETNFLEYEIEISDIVKLSIIGYGITQDNKVLTKIMKILEQNNIQVKDINLNQSKIEIIVNDIENSVVNELHENLIEREEINI